MYFLEGQNNRAGARESGLENQGRMAGQGTRGEMGVGNGTREWERVPEGMGEGAREGGKWSHLGGPTRNFFLNKLSFSTFGEPGPKEIN